jgi:hypothetical protein
LNSEDDMEDEEDYGVEEDENDVFHFKEIDK